MTLPGCGPKSARDVAMLATWRPASGHPKGWRVVREFYPPLSPPEGQARFQEAEGPSGRLRVFKTRQAAAHVAAVLNAAG